MPACHGLRGVRTAKVAALARYHLVNDPFEDPGALPLTCSPARMGLTLARCSI